MERGRRDPREGWDIEQGDRWGELKGSTGKILGIEQGMGGLWVMEEPQRGRGAPS